MTNEPIEGATCPKSHRIVRQTLLSIVRLLLILIAASLIYLVYSSR